MDRTYPDSLGAGKTHGSFGTNGYNGWSSKAAIGGVNVAVKAYANSVGTYGGDGDGAFKNTVIHETGHAFTNAYKSFYDAPAEDCDRTSHIDLSLGGITNYNNVSPMQTWSTGQSDDGNPAVCDNCTGNPDALVSGVTSVLSDCAVREMEEYVSKT